jgi:hypothetical protein
LNVLDIETYLAERMDEEIVRIEFIKIQEYIQVPENNDLLLSLYFDQ